MIRRLAAYAWAGPNTLLGLAFGGLVLVFGGRARTHRGVLEIAGGLLGSTLASPRVRCPYRAVTLGHVILATNAAALDACRAHEHVHVRQYERWGPLFLPAYFISSAWQLLRGRRCYLDNYFERQSRERS